MTAMTTDDRVKVTIRLNPELHRAIAVQLAIDQRTWQDMLETAARIYLDEANHTRAEMQMLPRG